MLDLAVVNKPERNRRVRRGSAAPVTLRSRWRAAELRLANDVTVPVGYKHDANRFRAISGQFMARRLGRGIVSAPYFQMRMPVECSLLVSQHHARTLGEFPRLATPRILQRNTNFLRI